MHHKFEAFKKRTIEIGFKKAMAKQRRSVNRRSLMMLSIYVCFWQQRELNIPVSGALLQEKAKVLFQRLCPDATKKKFAASVGFQWRFSRSNFCAKSLTLNNFCADQIEWKNFTSRMYDTHVVRTLYNYIR